MPIYQTVGRNNNGEIFFDTFNYDTRYNGANKYRHTRTGRAFLKNYVGKDYKIAGKDVQTKLYEGYDSKGLVPKIMGNTLGYKVKNIRKWARNLGKSGRQGVLNTYMYRPNGVDSKVEDQNRDVLDSRDKVLTTFGQKFVEMYNNPVLAATLNSYVRAQGIDTKTGKFNNQDMHIFRVDKKKYVDSFDKYIANPDLALVDNIDWKNLGIKKFKQDLMGEYYSQLDRQPNERRAKKDLRRQNLRSIFSPIAGIASSGSYILQSVSQAAQVLGSMINNTVNAASSAVNINVNSRGKTNDDEMQEQ